MKYVYLGVLTYATIRKSSGGVSNWIGVMEWGLGLTVLDAVSGDKALCH